MTAKEGKYIYCIIETKTRESFDAPGIGGRGDLVHVIQFNDIGAVVSDSPIIDYRISRANMICHEKAIEEVMKDSAVLPVRFGTIAENEEKVKKILEKEYNNFKNLLADFKEKKELGLKAVFSEKDIYRDILEKHAVINKLKEEIAVLSPEKSYYQRMEIGKMVEQALEEEKNQCQEDILSVLEPLSEKNKINDTYGERMILNAAFLINNEKETEFDREVNELADKYGDRVVFKYVGTLPPFNFVNLVIKTGEY